MGPARSSLVHAAAVARRGRCRARCACASASAAFASCFHSGSHRSSPCTACAERCRTVTLRVVVPAWRLGRSMHPTGRTEVALWLGTGSKRLPDAGIELDAPGAFDQCPPGGLRRIAPRLEYRVRAAAVWGRGHWHLKSPASCESSATSPRAAARRGPGVGNGPGPGQHGQGPKVVRAPVVPRARAAAAAARWGEARPLRRCRRLRRPQLEHPQLRRRPLRRGGARPEEPLEAPPERQGTTVAPCHSGLCGSTRAMTPTTKHSPCAQPPVGRVVATVGGRMGQRYLAVLCKDVLGIACERAQMNRTDGGFHGSAGPAHPLGRRCASTRLTVSLRVAQVWPAYPRQRNRPARPHMLTTRSLTRMDARKHAQSRSQTDDIALSGVRKPSHLTLRCLRHCLTGVLGCSP